MVPGDRAGWLESLRDFKDGQDIALRRRADEIAALARRRGIAEIFSVGAGAGALEYFLKKSLPSVLLTASDYSGANIERLRRVFTECDDVTVFDITQADWSSMGGNDSRSTLVLMYRVDTNLSNRQWRVVFQNMARSRVRNVLFVPANIMTLRSLAKLRMRNVRARLHGEVPLFTGYIRNLRMYPRLWNEQYRSESVLLLETPSFWLSLSD